MENLKNKLSHEQLQQRIAEAEYETKLLLLRQAERSNADFEQRESQRHRSNEQRQGELNQMIANYHRRVRDCRHKSGGRPDNILKGGGVGSFSTISRTLMPDGVTLFLQCPRCGMKEYTPVPPAKPQGSAATKEATAKYESALIAYAKDTSLFDSWLEASVDAGFENYMRGPTFAFKNAEGVPFIPARV
jgi:hypothetical protein